MSKQAYKEYLKSEDWDKKRLAKLGRKAWAKKRCAVCGDDTKIEVHHLIYRKDLTEVKQSDLRILCKRCHKLAHKLLKNGKLKYRNENTASRFALMQWAIKKHLKGNFKTKFIENNQKHITKYADTIEIIEAHKQLDDEFRAITCA